MNDFLRELPLSKLILFWISILPAVSFISVSSFIEFVLIIPIFLLATLRKVEGKFGRLFFGGVALVAWAEIANVITGSSNGPVARVVFLSGLAFLLTSLTSKSSSFIRPFIMVALNLEVTAFFGTVNRTQLLLILLISFATLVIPSFLEIKSLSLIEEIFTRAKILVLPLLVILWVFSSQLFSFANSQSSTPELTRVQNWVNHINDPVSPTPTPSLSHYKLTPTPTPTSTPSASPSDAGAATETPSATESIPSVSTATPSSTAATNPTQSPSPRPTPTPTPTKSHHSAKPSPTPTKSHHSAKPSPTPTKSSHSAKPSPTPTKSNHKPLGKPAKKTPTNRVLAELLLAGISLLLLLLLFLALQFGRRSFRKWNLRRGSNLRRINGSWLFYLQQRDLYLPLKDARNLLPLSSANEVVQRLAEMNEQALYAERMGAEIDRGEVDKLLHKALLELRKESTVPYRIRAGFRS